ncbi:MAG TPA: hypothetical protein VFS21_13575 [Roseiflexaceae bacterium]|nr:hypothetical protein [Roseiflexaceae bacterium]
MEIHWTPPEPRKGLLGRWDAFVGPGATGAEEWVQLGGGLVLAGLALACFAVRFPGEPSWAQMLCVVLLALDLSGGIITNATASAKRWYHRAGQGARQHLAFVLPHGLHLALLAGVFPEVGWGFALLFYGLLVAATLLILRTPLYLQRPVAFACFAAVLPLGALFAPPVGLEWAVPFLFLKLLIAHLLKEAPFGPGQELQS